MANPPTFLGNGPIFNWSPGSTVTASATFTVSGVPVGSLLLLGAALEIQPNSTWPQPLNFVNAPTPGTWFTVFNYVPYLQLPYTYDHFALMYKFADSNDASSTGQTYTITAGDARSIKGGGYRRSGGQLFYWGNVHPTTPVALIQGRFLLPTGTQYAPSLSSAVASVVFFYWCFQVTVNAFPEGQLIPPGVTGWSSTGSGSGYMQFYYHTTPGDTFFPGVTYQADPSFWNKGWGHGLVLVPPGPPYPPTANPNPSLTRSRAVPLAIAGPRLNEVTAAYKPVIRVY